MILNYPVLDEKVISRASVMPFYTLYHESHESWGGAN